ncbi:DNA methyltransferase [Kocuria sp.]|uniref:DNA methyltransferase n=1 Tax=Kocuria sp. TaxID=1871328 RepID=UPI0026E07D94|nr:hypothetical protein [Kocuria sp.]MDO5619449.1 hypothetical protein [Kocuria sp.]
MTTSTTTVLNSEQRRFLDTQTQRAREAAQRAAEDALRALAIGEPSRPAYLNDEQNTLRLALRDKARQLGDDTAHAGAPLTNLIHDVAYEQWHRLLFARFLEVNGLLRHPEFRDIPLSLDDCSDLAPDLGEPDAWAVAAQFASEILPGVFRLTDPAVQVRFPAEHRNVLERLLLAIPAEVFTTEDALGWVYQFWQTAEKKRVNDSGVKIGGADLSPVTQLFTENYMVRFLLENSLGAWWAARHPDSPLIEGWEYLRRSDDGTLAAGSFNEWPDRAADVTVMDPCCGSGHFLVAMFGMLWRMRAEEEGLATAKAQDAVLRDNLHGLELDPRCTQIATFNVALEAWKQGGFRDLPAPQIACSGVPVRASRMDWESLARDDGELRKVMGALHALFRNADTLGSLIDPRPDGMGDGLFSKDTSVGIGWRQVGDVLRVAVQNERPASPVLGDAVDDVVAAAGLLGRSYTLIATNVPYLGSQLQSENLRDHIQWEFPQAGGELGAAFLLRWSATSGASKHIAAVVPGQLGFLRSFGEFRKDLLEHAAMRMYCPLGPRAFREIGGEVVQPALIGIGAPAASKSEVRALSVTAVEEDSLEGKARQLRDGPFALIDPESWRANKGIAFSATVQNFTTRLSSVSTGAEGLSTGDNGRFVRHFWEINFDGQRWAGMQGAPTATAPYAGLEYVVRWDRGAGALVESDGARIQGLNHLNQRGVIIGRMSTFRCAIYLGGLFDKSCVIAVPRRQDDLAAIWAFAESGELERAVRAIDTKVGASTATVLNAAFDVDKWRKAVDGAHIPLPEVVNPSQWLFSGSLPGSAYPLQVGVARLLGFRWRDQLPDALDQLVDADGIAALTPLPGEPDLATRLRQLLATAYGAGWSSGLERQLVTEAGGKNGRLDDWLRDFFFNQHVRVFDNRPFLWHIWDGRKDGFAVIVNYHKLDRRTLEKLTFTSLGAWIERQKHEARAKRAGADARLAAAEELQRRLKLILEGAPPYDIYVRWKAMSEQPIGWEPDLDDGVRLNIRPFVEAGALRSKVNVHWKKDRGKNPDGTERHNDLHPTLEERRRARREAEAAQ